jgi:hypothetical protein
MKISPVGKSTSPATPRNQTQQARQTQPQSRSQPAALPLPTRNQNQQTTPQGLPRSKSLPTYLPAMSRSQTKDTTTLVPDKDKSTIKYATQAALNGNPLTAADLSRVRQVNHGMDETRNDIQLRQNVSRDIRQNGPASKAKIDTGNEYAKNANRELLLRGRTLQAREASNQISPEEAMPIHKSIKADMNTNTAAYATVAGGGNCGEMSYATTRNLAGKSLKGDTIKTERSAVKAVDHATTTVTPAEGSYNSKLIADSWMIGPGHRQKDGLNIHNAPLEPLETFASEEDKARISNDFNNKIQQIRMDEKRYPRMQTQIRADIEKRKYLNFPSEPVVDKKRGFNGVYNEAQSLSPEFRDGARAAALRAVQLDGRPQKGKALVVPKPEYTIQLNNHGNTVRVQVQRDRVPEQHVNDMIPLVANELGIPRNDRDTFDSLAIDDLATHVGGVVRREAMKSESAPFREEHDKWVNKK